MNVNKADKTIHDVERLYKTLQVKMICSFSFHLFTAEE